MADDAYTPSSGTVSPEGIVVKHFMEQIALLPQTWMGDGGFDRQKFNMQIGFLIRHLPDRGAQIVAMQKWNEKLDELKALNFEPDEVSAFAGMGVVTELMQFIYEAFELIHYDIVGPATTRQFQDSVITIPDLPQPGEIVEKVDD